MAAASRRRFVQVLPSTSVPATATLAGGGTLTATSTVTHQAVAALAGGGTLAATATATGSVTATATLAGGGTLAATATVTHAATASLAGGGTLAATATATSPGDPVLLTAGRVSAASSFTTASVTVTAGRLYLINVLYTDGGGGVGDDMTVTGPDATACDYAADEGGHWTAGMFNVRRVRVFRYMPTATTTGTFTGDATNATYFMWQVVEIDGAEPGSNGANAVVRATHSRLNCGPPGVRLEAHVYPNEALHDDHILVAFHLIGWDNADVYTPSPGWTQLGGDVVDTNLPAHYFMSTEYRNDGDSTTNVPNHVQWTVAEHSLHYVLEIKRAGTGTQKLEVQPRELDKGAHVSASNLVSASVTPVANTALTLDVVCRWTAGEQGDPTISTTIGGLTTAFTKIAHRTYDTAASPRSRIVRYYAVVGASPVAGTVTIATAGAGTAYSKAFQLAEWAGLKQTGPIGATTWNNTNDTGNTLTVSGLAPAVGNYLHGAASHSRFGTALPDDTFEDGWEWLFSECDGYGWANVSQIALATFWKQKTDTAVDIEFLADTSADQPGGMLVTELIADFISATATLDGGGTLAATSTVTHQAVASLGGGGALAATATVAHQATAVLVGGGTLEATATLSHDATAVLVGGGVLTAAALAITVGSGIGRERVQFHNDQRVTFRSNS